MKLVSDISCREILPCEIMQRNITMRKNINKQMLIIIIKICFDINFKLQLLCYSLFFNFNYFVAVDINKT